MYVLRYLFIHVCIYSFILFICICTYLFLYLLVDLWCNVFCHLGKSTAMTHSCSNINCSQAQSRGTLLRRHPSPTPGLTTYVFEQCIGTVCTAQWWARSLRSRERLLSGLFI